MILLYGSKHLPRGNDQGQARHVEQQHDVKYNRGTFGRSPEFFPDKNAPERSYYRSTLPQPVRNGWSRLSGCNDTKRHAHTPDHATKYSGNMVFEPTFHVVGIGHGRTYEWPAHQK